MGGGVVVERPENEPRRLPLWFVLGVYILPSIFCWFLLRKGYSEHVRRGAFFLAAYSVVTAFVALTDPPFR